MNAYIYDKINNIIDIKVENVNECNKDSIKGSNIEVSGMNLNRVGYIVTNKEYEVGSYLNKNEEDMRHEIIRKNEIRNNLEEENKILKEQLSKVLKFIEKQENI